ncbi:hypothetical protein F5883DRAFT_244519 [Diaporthe sp. PMI_573]|nr:hypothetical protein F5883DRAFT_244519 [Diaporthaceae sp. PMI_573]
MLNPWCSTLPDRRRRIITALFTLSGVIGMDHTSPADTSYKQLVTEETGQDHRGVIDATSIDAQGEELNWPGLDGDNSVTAESAFDAPPPISMTADIHSDGSPSSSGDHIERHPAPTGGHVGPRRPWLGRTRQSRAITMPPSSDVNDGLVFYNYIPTDDPGHLTITHSGDRAAVHDSLLPCFISAEAAIKAGNSLAYGTRSDHTKRCDHCSFYKKECNVHSESPCAECKKRGVACTNQRTANETPCSECTKRNMHGKKCRQ